MPEKGPAVVGVPVMTPWPAAGLAVMLNPGGRVPPLRE
jgi:hypothetical protein